MASDIELALLSGDAYISSRPEMKNRFSVPVGWTLIPNTDWADDTTGFEYVAYTNGAEIVLSYAGTNPVEKLNDIARADLAIGLGLNNLGIVSDQLLQAASAYIGLRIANPDTPILLTGHSLGGGLASLIAIFFDQNAVTFDQAPFRNSASWVVANSIKQYLLDVYPIAKYPSITRLLQPLEDFISSFDPLGLGWSSNGLAARETKVRGYNTIGEFLSLPLPNTFLPVYRVGTSLPLGQTSTSPDAGLAVDLHSQALLVALLTDNRLGYVADSFPDLFRLIFDTRLYSFDTATTKENFIDRLVRHQYGNTPDGVVADGMLTRFIDDAGRIASSSNTNNGILDALLVYAMQMYYQSGKSTDKGQHLFDDISGGVHFDRTNVVADPGYSAKGDRYLRRYLQDQYAGENLQRLVSSANEVRDWYFQLTQPLGAHSLTAQAGVDGSFMLGGDEGDTLTGNLKTDILLGNAGSDTLVGNAGADILVGGADADTLTGGTGDDKLFGGAGNDTYQFASGDGSDTLIDSDGAGIIKVDGTPLTGGKKAAPDYWLGDKQNGKQYSYALVANGSGGNDLVIERVDGSDRITVRSWQAGQLGITLDSTPYPVSATHTAVDGDSNQALGGSGGDDSLEGGGGDDVLLGGLGRDTLNGGAGRDYIFGSDAGSISTTPLPADLVVPGPEWSRGGDMTPAHGNTWVAYDGGKDPTGMYDLASFIGIGEASYRLGDSPSLIDGGAGNDMIWSGSGDDVVHGGADKDAIVAMAGNDIVRGDDGDDKIWGDGIHVTTYEIYVAPENHGRDVLDGGAGNDYVEGQGNDDEVYGGDGNDVLWGDSGTLIDTPLSAHGNDYVDGGSGSDSLVGGGKDDELFGGSGDDHLWGDSDPDTVFTEAYQGKDYLDGEDGNDTLIGDGDDDELFGGIGDDNLYGDAQQYAGVKVGDDYLDGEDGDDLLVGGGKDDQLFGGDGNDWMWGDADDQGLDDSDNGKDYLDGEAGADQLTGGGDDDELYGGEGNDSLRGDGEVSLVGGDSHGNDYLDGEDGNDILAGDGGDDTLFGGSGADELQGDYGGTLAGQYHGDDMLSGGDGNDTLFGDGGSDILDGGADDDYLMGDDASVDSQYQGNDQLDGGDGNDTLLGGGGNDALDGGAGADVLEGDSGSDRILGGSGADQLIGDDGNDTMNGGSDDDVLFADSGNDILMGEDGADQLHGGEGDDSMNGGIGDDLLFGDAGNDTLDGGGGHDYLDGGDGNDRLSGDGGSVLIGADGADTLEGCAGDTLVGGDGDDTYYYRAGDGVVYIYEDSAPGANNTLYFDDSIDPSQISLGLGSLKLDLGNGDVIHIENFNPNDALNSSAIQRFEFADGTVLSPEKLMARGFDIGGTAGNDRLMGTNVDDRIMGGAGADLLGGGVGNDTYYYDRGDGVDSIYDAWGWVGADGSTVYDNNTLALGSNIDSSQLAPTFDNLSRHVSLNLDDGGSIDIGFVDNIAVQALAFSDGSSQWIAEFLAQTPLSVEGSDSSEAILGTPFADVIDGRAGNDAMTGGAGSDVFVYAVGDGADVIVDSAPYFGYPGADGNTLRFGPGIKADAISVRRDGDSCVLDLGNGDTIDVGNHAFRDLVLHGPNPNADPFTYFSIQVLEFDDGFKVNIQDFVTSKGLLKSGSQEADSLAGDDLHHGWIPDRFHGGEGNDTLSGGGGSDIYEFGHGDGSDAIYDSAVGTFYDPVWCEYKDNAPNFVSFGAQITARDVASRLDPVTGKLLLDLGGGDQIDVGSQWDLAVQSLHFADGTETTIETYLAGRVTETIGTNSNDEVGGLNNFANHMQGFAGDDLLSGGSVSDVLAGGVGDDRLYGNMGDDNYVFGRGDGADYVGDSGWRTGTDEAGNPVRWAENNTLSFAAGIDVNGITPVWKGEELSLDLGNGDSIDVGSIVDLSIQTLRFDGDTTISLSDFLAQKSALQAVATASDDLLATFGNGQPLLGMAGNDQLYGSVLDDTLQGGAGNDTLVGAAGDDTYVYELGDGSDILIDQADASSAGGNTLRFGAGIADSSVTPILDVATDRLSLELTNGDRIDIGSVYSPSIQYVAFDNAAPLSLTEWVNQRGGLYQGGTSDDDWLDGTSMSDRLLGGAGNDSLTASGGDDLLVGGAGNDFLAGGYGNDVYVFNRGDGDDRISDMPWGWEGEYRIDESNTLRLEGGTTPEMVTASVDAYGNVTLDLGGGEHVAIGTQDMPAIQRVEYSNGASFSTTEILAGKPIAASIADMTTLQYQDYGFVMPTGSFVDPNGDALEYTATLANGDSLPDWLRFDANSLTFAGMPTDGDAGYLEIRVSASDPGGFSASTNFGLTVIPVDDSLTAGVELPDQVTRQGDSYGYVIPGDAFVNPFGGALDCSICRDGYAPLPDWLKFDPLTGTLSGVPGNDDVRSMDLVVSATNVHGKTTSSGFHLDVLNVNDAPSASGVLPDQRITSGQPLLIVLDTGIDTSPSQPGFLDDLTDAGTGQEVAPDYSYLNGGEGNDTYQFGRGAGSVYIEDFDSTAGNVDTVMFGSNITPDDVRVDVTRWDELRVSIIGTADTLTLGAWDAFPDSRIERFVFGNGIEWSADQLIAKVSGVSSTGNDRIVGTGDGDAINAAAGDDCVFGMSGNDVLTGSAGHDLLEGGGGSDVMSGGSGNDAIEADDSYADLAGDLLVGGSGDDMLWASVSNDVLIGGSGNDELNADDGSDVILFNRGDGKDLLHPYSSGGDAAQASRRDTLSLGGGIAFDDLALARRGDDLVLLAGGDDTVTLEGWFSDPPNRVVTTLQMIVAGMSGYSAMAADALLRERVKQFDFAGLTRRFEEALAADPSVSSWQLAAHMSDFVVGSSDVAAIGGDMAYVYGRYGSLAKLDRERVVGQLDTVGFGSVAQVLSSDAVTESQGLFDDIDFRYGDSLTYSADLEDGTPLPAWLRFDSATRTFSGTPTNGDSGELQVRVTATDTGGLSASIVFGVEVVSLNSAPVVSEGILNQVAYEDAAFEFTLSADAFSDPDAGDALTYGLTMADGTPLPSWLSFDASTRTLSGVPGNGDVGDLALKVVATDGGSLSASTEFDLAVLNVNDAPTVSSPIGDLNATEDATFNFVVPADAFADVDVGDQLSLSASLADGSPLPSWLIFDAATGSFSGTPGNGDVGSLVVRVTGTDLAGANAASMFTLSVANVNDAPTLDIPVAGQAATEGVGFALSLPQGSFSDIDVGDVLTYSATLSDGASLPAWLSFNVATLSFSGTPTAADIGSLQVKVSAADPGGLSASTIFQLDIGQHPAISLVGTANGDTLAGFSGDDTLDGGAGADTLVGELGDDTYLVDDGADCIVENPNQGCDTVLAAVTYVLAENVEKLTLTGSANINATGNALDNVLTGNAGTNILAGGGGNDTYYVGVGDAVSESANAGVDTVVFDLASGDKRWILEDNVENLILRGDAMLNGYGNALDNQITGTAKGNILDGGAGADTLIGGLGDDGYAVDNIDDVVIELAGEGYDWVTASVSYSLPDNVERLSLMGTGGINCMGNALDNVLYGNQNANLVSGGAGNDTLDGGTGADTLVGGVGNDSYVVDNVGDIVTEVVGEGMDSVQSSIAYTLGANVENLTLSGASSINGTGNSLDNYLTGNFGNNVLTAYAGNDTLDGGYGIDMTVGGLGNDTYYVDNCSDGVTELAGEGEDIIISSVNRTINANVEHLILTGSSNLNGTGNTANNLLRGNAGINILNGAAGLDFLEGLGGNDTLTDTSGNGYLHGGAGADTLAAGGGSDMLIGGSGNDTLTGGDGYNVILFNMGDGVDTLTVGTGAHDTLSLGGGIAYGDLAFRKNGNDLVLDTGNGESMTFKNWYVGTANKNVLNLQVCVEAMAGFDPNSSNPLLSSKIEDFDFKGLASAFDSALAANPALTSWALSNGLTQFHLSSSDSAALGGDLAYQYGKGGTLAGIGITSAQQVMGDSQFGVQAQTLRPFSGLQDGVVQLS